MPKTKTNAKVKANTNAKAKTNTKAKTSSPTRQTKISGYGAGSVKHVISVEAIAREVSALSAKAPSQAALQALTGSADEPYLVFENVTAGYGKMMILRDFNLRLARGQSLCLIGPNGAGKSTILHTLYGFNTIEKGRILLNGVDVTHLAPNDKLARVKVAYLLQESSVFPNMTVEENLLMGGFLLNNRHKAAEATKRVLEKYPRLAARRKQPASALSGGERRLLEISRALIMDPDVLLVDEPSIGLEPRFIDMVFELLTELRDREKKTILMVEQNAKKGLEFAELAYVLVNGHTALAGHGNDLLADKRVGKLFLGG